MANFKTHMLGAALVSGVAATVLNMAGAISQHAVLGYFSLGVVGGLLPDIDSDMSIPVRVGFNLLSVLAAFMVVFYCGPRWSLAEVVSAGLLAFILMRYVVFGVFARFTTHRGLVHSIPAGLIFGLLATLIAWRLFNTHPVHAWFCGIFILLGFLVHLLLDEIYSVNLMGAYIKRSFGSALRFWNGDNLLGSVGLYLVAALLLTLTPPAAGLTPVLLDGRIYHTLSKRLWPRGEWFRGQIYLCPLSP